LQTNVLYISYDGLTDPLGQSQILPYLIGLSKNGYRFTIISCEKAQLFNKKKEAIHKICREAGIVWEPVFYTKFPPVFSTLWDLYKIISKAEKLFKQQQFKIVHCRSYIASLVGLRLKRKYAIRFIFDMRGFWADERVDGNLWNLSNPVYKKVFQYFKRKEKEFLAASDQIISLTIAAKKELLSWRIANVNSEKITVIPCATQFCHFKVQTEASKAHAREKLGLNYKDFVLTYIGSLGTWYLLDDMLRFFSVLKKRIDNATFLILTKDAQEVSPFKLKQFGLCEKDIVLTFAERENIPEIVHASDYGIFFIKPSYSKMSSSPTKMGELLAMGIPLICNNNVGDVEDIVERLNCGFCINEPGMENFDQAIKLIQTKNYDAFQIREKALTYFDLNMAINKYLHSYTYLI